MRYLDEDFLKESLELAKTAGIDEDSRSWGGRFCWESCHQSPLITTNINPGLMSTPNGCLIRGVPFKSFCIVTIWGVPP